MAKRRREPDSDGTTTSTAEYNTVFIDTSLDTHLAMLVSNSDTVSDFKKKMVLEHMQCFQKIGEIQIHSLKVKRKGNFYHLPDIMLVWSAFHGVKGNWFLSADASGTPACHLNQNFSELGTSHRVKMDVRNVDDDCRGLSSNVNMIQTIPKSLPDGVNEKNVVSEIEKSLEKTIDFQISNYSAENCMETESRAKKKRKVRHTEDVCHNPSSKGSCTLFHASGKDTSIPEIVGCRNSMVDAVKEGPESMVLNEQQGKPAMSEATAEVSGVRNDQSDIAHKVAFEGTSAPDTAKKSTLGSIVNSQNQLGSDKRKEDTVLESIITENLMASKLDHELGQDVPTEHSGGVSVKVPDLSARSMDPTDAMGDVNSDGTKRKKKKDQKIVAEIQDRADMEQTRKPHTETYKSEIKEEEKGLSLNCDDEAIMPSNSKALDHADPDFALKEAPEVSSGGKKKKNKRGKKSADTNIEKSGIEQTDNGFSGYSGLLCPLTDHIPEETDKEESILYHKGKDVQMKLLENSTLGAGEKVQGANRNEADFVILTQTKQTQEDVATGKRKMEKMTQRSAGNYHADCPTVEKENETLEFNQVEKDIENTENKDKKAKKKKKKRKPTASDVQENLPVKDQKGGIEALTIEENSISFVNSEQEGRHVASSQVLSRKSEEKREEMHENAVKTDDIARTSENGGEGINFKQYFVSGQYQDKVDSSDKVKKATKSNEDMKSSKKVKEHGLPSVSISTELQNSLKSFENQESENKSRVRKNSGRRQGDSAQNSDWDEVISNSLRRSSRVSENGAKDSSPSEVRETTLKKPNEILAESSCLNQKNPSLDKSSSERPEKFPKKRGNKRSQSGLNVTNKMVMKTPQKKSLFAKSGAIFQDNSGESSADENGPVHSDDSTRSPSDSSSQSGYSVGESDLSQDSTRNGSNNAKGRSTGGKNMSKLDSLSASKDMTMDMILRRSKRFKKAKLLASQNENESQLIEFVPDSQPI
ncbi:hypothetical protein Pfo_024300 [Paulownia fortunei]|nr:hypothetical protein Pfo_024300 [Paulownia fortunei]